MISLALFEGGRDGGRGLRAAMAVEKVAVDTKIATVAKEIGANESLVARGARATRQKGAPDAAA